jgi:hypothetical protein
VATTAGAAAGRVGTIIAGAAEVARLKTTIAIIAAIKIKL